MNIEVALRLCSLSLFLFLLLLLAVRYSRHLRARLGLGFILSVISYLVLSLGWSDNWPITIRSLLVLNTSLLAFFYWVLTLSVFDDSFRLTRNHAIVFTLKVLIGLTALPGIGLDLRSTGESLDLLAFYVSSLFSLALIVAAVVQIVPGVQDDLVESRRQLRKIHIVVSSGVIAFIMLNHLIFRSGKWIPYLNQLDSALVFILVAAFMLISLQFREGLLEDQETTDGNADTEYQIDHKLKQKLLKLLEADKVYRREGLTIRELASLLETHEYKVRRLINWGLGFRNFNDFINRYRIQEACEILLDEEKSDIPVIRIAMDLGYQSLGPFNRAFKELTGVTPSEYRKGHSVEKKG